MDHARKLKFSIYIHAIYEHIASIALCWNDSVHRRVQRGGSGGPDPPPFAGPPPFQL